MINHEYVNPTLHTDGMRLEEGRRPLEQVRKEQAAHGLSVIEVRKDAGASGSGCCRRATTGASAR